MKRRVGSVAENLEPRVVLSVSAIPRDVVETSSHEELTTDTQPAANESFNVASHSRSSVPSDADVNLGLDQQPTNSVDDRPSSHNANSTTVEDKRHDELIVTEVTNSEVTNNKVIVNLDALTLSDSHEKTNDSLTKAKRTVSTTTTLVDVDSPPDSLGVTDGTDDSTDRIETIVSDEVHDGLVIEKTQPDRVTVNAELDDANRDLAEDSSNDLRSQVDANDVDSNSGSFAHQNDLACDGRMLLDDCSSVTARTPDCSTRTADVQVEESEIPATSEGWLDAISLSVATWISSPAKAPDPFLGSVGMPAVTVASALSIFAMSRKSVSDADRPKLESAADWIAQLDRRWWRECRRCEPARDRTRRELPKKQRPGNTSRLPIDLSTPEISDSFAMALMSPIDADAFQMDLIENDTNDQDTLNASMIAATCGAVAFGATKAMGKKKRNPIGPSTAHGVCKPGTTLVQGSN